MFTVDRIETLKMDRDVLEKVSLFPFAGVMKKGVFTVDRDLIELTGNLNAGILLSRVVQLLHEDKGIVYNKQRWISRTKAEWFAETGLTVGMFDRAIRKLEKNGFVQTHKANIKGRVTVLIRQHKPFLDEAMTKLQSQGKGE